MSRKQRLLISVLVALGILKLIHQKAISMQNTLNLNTQSYTKKKMELILEELHTNYTPYFIHYYQQLVNLKRDYGQTN